MVDVTGKPWTLRKALAKCRVALPDGWAREVAEGPASDQDGTGGSWAELLFAARLTGIQAAKRTAELVPLCHPLSLSKVDVRLSVTRGCVEIEAQAEVVGPTGVEMEALTACAFAALAIVSSVEDLNEGASVEDLELWEKRGGRSGTWVRRRSADEPPRVGGAGDDDEGAKGLRVR